MAGIAVAQLRVRGEPSRAGATAFMVEDALRTAIPDEDRLVLVRALPLGMMSASDPPHRRTRQADHAWRRATGSAVHGAAADAASANCVWFASAAEARRLLLAELLAGRAPRGWFWRLAVPDWQARPVEEWLADTVAAALDSGEIESIVAIVDALDEARVSLMLRAIERAIAIRYGASPASRPFQPQRNPIPDAVSLTISDTPGAQSDGLAALESCRARIDPPLLAVLERLVRRLGPDRRVTEAILAAVLRRASPALALAPAALKRLTIAYCRALERSRLDPVMLRETNLRVTRSAGARAASAGAEAQPTGVGAPGVDVATASRRPVEHPSAIESRDATGVVADPTPAFERFSPAAGLWLAIPALRRLGFREWLAGRPDLLGDDPGGTLLRRIGRHHRVSDDDPAMAMLGAEPVPTGDWVRLWRTGLDRWLRRTARLPLAALVWRDGWLATPAEQTVRVRFPLDAIDMRLRRHALDADPGWTDWLGLSVRYRFDDRAAT